MQLLGQLGLVTTIVLAKYTTYSKPGKTQSTEQRLIAVKRDLFFLYFALFPLDTSNKKQNTNVRSKCMQTLKASQQTSLTCVCRKFVEVTSTESLASLVVLTEDVSAKLGESLLF